MGSAEIERAKRGELMGWDQVSLFLYPPRWRYYSVADPKAKHSSGQPVRIVSAVRSENDDAPPVLFGDVRRWLEARGFNLVVQGKWRAFQSPLIATHFEPQPEIEVHWSEEAGEVAHLYCRFQINRETPMRLEHWEAFMRDLCATFQMRIGLSDTESASAEEFPRVIRLDDNWRGFAAAFGWEQT